MYNSYVISVSTKIFKWIIHLYNNSFMKKILVSIGGGFSYISKGSSVKELIVSEKPYTVDSGLYKTIDKLVKIINNTMEKTNNYIVKIGETSLYVKIIKSIYGSKTDSYKDIHNSLQAKDIGIINNSIVCKIIRDFFAIDEGGTNYDK